MTEKKNPILNVMDGGAGNKEILTRFRGSILDTKSDNFLGSGLSFHEWFVIGEHLRYTRWYISQSREEQRRRMKYLILLCAEQERILTESIGATGLSERAIENVIEGDWNGVKCGINTLKFQEDDPAEYREVMVKRFANFVKILQEAYDSRPKVFCPVCLRPTPNEDIGGFHDGRHNCPWCLIVHDDEGNYVERDKANLTVVTQDREEDGQ